MWATRMKKHFQKQLDLVNNLIRIANEMNESDRKVSGVTQREINHRKNVVVPDIEKAIVFFEMMEK